MTIFLKKIKKMSKSVQLLSAFMSYDSLQKEWEPYKRNILKKKKVI